jgi:hypothetical protein
MQSTWAPDAPYVQIGVRYATLADREQAAPTLATWGATHGTPTFWALMRQPARQVLLETLQLTNPGGAPKWSVGVTLAPALGKSEELRSLLLELRKQDEAQGRRTALSVQVAGPESGSFARTLSFDSLGDVEAWRAGFDRGSEYARKRDALLSRPPEVGIREILVPYAVP